MSTKLKNTDLNSDDAKPMLGEVKEVEIIYKIGDKERSFNIHKKQMQDVKINDYWAWLNRFVPTNQAKKLLDIADCDYKIRMIYQYSKL